MAETNRHIGFRQFFFFRFPAGHGKDLGHKRPVHGPASVRYLDDKHSFYDGLNKFSYYNSFFRVKADLLEKGLIRIEKDEYNRTYIQLTNKGLQVYDKLIEIAILLTDSIINK